VKTKTIISLFFLLSALLGALATGCAFKKKPVENPAPVTPLVVPSPEIPLPTIPLPPPIPQPQIDPSPGQPAPSLTTPNSSPTSPAPDVSPGRVPE
jgi:hypothetical protein